MSAAVQIGLHLPSREIVAAGRSDARRLWRIGELAAEIGFDSLWIGESVLARPRFDPIPVLGGLAARTDRVVLGTAVLLPALHHPLRLAHTLATLDRLTEGHLVVGVGLGFDYERSHHEFASLGVPFTERLARTIESVTIMRALWRGEGEDTTTISFERHEDGSLSMRGRFFSLERAAPRPPPTRPDGPPLWFAAQLGTAAGLRRTGALFDGWIPTSPSANAFAEGWDQVEQAARSAGRPEGAVTPAVILTLHVGSDPERARATLERQMVRYYEAPVDALARFQSLYAGTLDESVAWIGGFLRAGARHLVLRFVDPEPEATLLTYAPELLATIRAQAGALRKEPT